MTVQAEGTTEHVLLHVGLTTTVIHYLYILTALQILVQVSEKMLRWFAVSMSRTKADSIHFKISQMVSHFGKDIVKALFTGMV